MDLFDFYERSTLMEIRLWTNEKPCSKLQGIKHQKIAVIPRLDRGIQNKGTGFSGQARE